MDINPKATFDPEEIVREFIRDVEAVGPEQVKQDWPDLYFTYQRAKRSVQP